ncbi:MAG: DUF4190 domain-containing protein [Planctomycetota bacterium]
MAENTFQGGSVGGDPFGIPDEPDRTSILAILSLVSSLVCCIPGLGLIGSGLGVGAIVGISSSRGRVGGKGLAIAGIIIGALVTFGWLGIGLAINEGISKAAEFGVVVEHSVNDDVASARSVLAPATEQVITDEQILAFGDQLEQAYGAYVGLPQGAAEYFGTFVETMSNQQNQPGFQTAQQFYPQTGQYAMIPVPIKFANGAPVIAVIADVQSGGPGSLPGIVNVLAELPDGSLIWLIDPPQPNAARAQPLPNATPPEPDAAPDAPGGGGDPAADPPAEPPAGDPPV